MTRYFGLTLVRSDQGDGGWSLHAPGASAEAIRTGVAPVLVSGEARRVNGAWDAPTGDDVRRAWSILECPDECGYERCPVCGSDAEITEAAIRLWNRVSGRREWPALCVGPVDGERQP